MLLLCRPPTAQFDLRDQVVEHMTFQICEPHPCSKEPFMLPVNLVFIALNELNMGFQPCTMLSAEKRMQSLYSSHLIAFVYYVLSEFFANEGNSEIVGAASIRQIQSNPLQQSRYDLSI